MKILFVEDDDKIVDFVLKGLMSAGFAVDRAADGEEGVSLALYERYDVMIVDIMLPRVDGIDLIKQIRAENINTPVIILSAKDRVSDRVRGLEAGADDYLTKPFAFSELLARIQALIRRATGTTESSTLSYGDLVMDLFKREVRSKKKRPNH